MIVSAWKDGHFNSRNTNYGLRIKKADCDRHFKQHWRSVNLTLRGGKSIIKVAITPSFWRNCSELRNKEIGKWLLKLDLIPWLPGEPPKFSLEPAGCNHFKVSMAEDG